MTSPYINTYLNTTVRIHPNQMDNNIRKHIKNSVEKEHLNKCFLDYGYLNKIHEIYTENDAEVVAEDPLACATFKVRMSCTLCRPILNSTIVCKVIGITSPLIYMVKGPLEIIVKTSININKDIFIFNQKKNIWTIKKENSINETETDNKKKYIELKEGVYLKVTIINKKIIDKSERILCTGYLENIATEKEIDDDNIIDKSINKYSSIKEYIDKESKIKKEEEEIKLEKINLSNLSEELDTDT